MKRTESEQLKAFNRFDLNLLRALDILLEEKNVTYAAGRMCVSQPAMSGALQRMREFFNDQLLVRIGREMHLTPRAQALVAPVRELLSSIRSTLDIEPNFDPRATRRTFTLAMSDYAASVIMPKVFALLTREAPYVTCQIEFIGSSSFSRLNSNDIEICVSPDEWRLYGNYEPGTEISTMPMFTDGFVCVVDRGNSIVGDHISLEDYRHSPHGVVRLGRGVTTIVEHTWALADLNLNVAAIVPSFSALISIIPGTPLIATTQARLAQKLIRSLPLKQVPCPIAIPHIREVMVWHSRNDFDPGHQFIRKIIEDAAREVEAEAVTLPIAKQSNDIAA